MLAFENVDFAQTIYLSKFFEAIEALAAVEYVNITEFRRESQNAGYIEPTGKIKLSANEIARIPDDPGEDPGYAGGINVVLIGGN